MEKETKVAAVSMKNITKTFGSVIANDKVNLDIYKGEILSLLGENGSGKTTLMNMLSGIYFPDEGQIFINGKEEVIKSPKDALRLGIGMVHQHFKLIDVLSATENIILGLPGESRETVLRTIDYLNRLPIQGVKLQLLHVLSDSDLADLYRAGEYTPLEKEEYLTLVGDCIAHLRADIVLHRLTGDGDKNTLLAPLWSLRKRDVLNHLHRYLRENHIRQGMSCKIDLSVIYNKPKDVL